MNPLERSLSFFGTSFVGGGGQMSLFEGEGVTTDAVKKLAHYLRHTRAVSALEYAILVGIIAIVISAAIVTLSGNITPVVKAVGDKVGTATVTQGVQK